MDAESETFVAEVAPALSRSNPYGDHESREGLLVACDTADSLTVGANQTYGFSGDIVAHALRGEGFDASEDGTGRGTPLIPVWSVTQDSTPVCTEELSPALKIGTGLEMGQPPAIAFALRGREGGAMPELVGETVSTIRGASGGSSRDYIAGSAVRRLTPRECERLQGFPDDYTAIPYRGKPASDGPRYKALGNSMAVPVMAWIGRRIAQVEALELVAEAA